MSLGQASARHQEVGWRRCGGNCGRCWKLHNRCRRRGRHRGRLGDGRGRGCLQRSSWEHSCWLGCWRWRWSRHRSWLCHRSRRGRLHCSCGLHNRGWGWRLRSSSWEHSYWLGCWRWRWSRHRSWLCHRGRGGRLRREGCWKNHRQCCRSRRGHVTCGACCTARRRRRERLCWCWGGSRRCLRRRGRSGSCAGLRCRCGRGRRSHLRLRGGGGSRHLLGGSWDGSRRL